MATRIVFDINKLNRFLSIYEKTQTEFAGKRALTKFGQRIKGSQGLAQRYKRIFQQPVPFTLNSTFTVQRGLELDVGVKDQTAITKGNPASKYLFPPIGGYRYFDAGFPFVIAFSSLTPTVKFKPCCIT